jgi:hypothetical protein
MMLMGLVSLLSHPRMCNTGVNLWGEGVEDQITGDELYAPWDGVGDVVDTFVDYYRVTDNTHRLRLLMDEQIVESIGLQDEWGREGVEGVPGHWLQYQGTKWGALFVGSCYQGSLLQESGRPWYLSWALAIGGLHCTRIDFQVTISVPDGKTDEIILALARRVTELGETGERRRLKYTYISGYGDGDTFYVGSRSSERFIRIYNKGAQSGQEASIRVEVELKGGLAEAAWADLRKSASHSLFSLQAVCGAAYNVGIPLPVRLQAANREFVRDSDKAKSHARTLKWLRESVKPTVSRLIKEGIEEAYLYDTLFDT